MSNIKKLIERRVTAATEAVVEQLFDKVVELHRIPRYWEAFNVKDPKTNEIRVTVRKNPQAPMRRVKAFRDNIDSFEMLESVEITPDGLGVEIAAEYAEYVLTRKPIMEVALEELNFADLFEDALDE
jgi:hypothetical protein